MDKKLLLAVIVLVTMPLVVACGDDDPNPVPEEAPHSLAVAYVQPTEIVMPDLTREDWETGYLIGPVMNFKGNEITFRNNPELFAGYNRLFGDTAYVRRTAKGEWPQNQRTFLVKTLVGLKAIAADDSWGKDFPEGSDVSEMFNVRYLRAARYVDSGYRDDTALVPTSVRMPDWKPEYGRMLCAQTVLEFLFVRAHYDEGINEENGHKYTLVATFDDGTTLTSYDNTFWCAHVYGGK